MRKKLFSLFIALTLLVTARPSLFSMNPKRRKTEKKIRLCSDVTGKIGEFCPRAEEFFAMRRVNHVWKKGVQYHNYGTLRIVISNSVHGSLLQFFNSFKGGTQPSFSVAVVLKCGPDYPYHLKDEDVVQLLRIIPKLKKLKLGGTKITGKCLTLIPTTSLAVLKKLDLGRCKNLNEQFLIKIFPQCNTIENLSLGSTGITGECLKYLPTSTQKSIKFLTLCCCEKIIESTIKKFLSVCMSLAELNLSNLSIAGDCLTNLTHSSQESLRKVYLSSCRDINENSVRTLLLGCTKLVELRLGDSEIMGQCFRNLPLSSLSSIEVLYLNPCNEVFDEENLIHSFPKFENLNVLNFCETSYLSGECLTKLPQSSLNNFLWINLTGNYMLEENYLTEFFSRCKHIQHIELDATNITGKCFKNLPNTARKSLVHLDLSNCPEIQENDLQNFLSTCTNLITLILDDTPITGDCLTNLPDLLWNSLENIVLRNCNNLKPKILSFLRKKYGEDRIRY